MNTFLIRSKTLRVRGARQNTGNAFRNTVMGKKFVSFYSDMIITGSVCGGLGAGIVTAFSGVPLTEVPMYAIMGVGTGALFVLLSPVLICVGVAIGFSETYKRARGCLTPSEKVLVDTFVGKEK